MKSLQYEEITSQFSTMYASTVKKKLWLIGMMDKIKIIGLLTAMPQTPREKIHKNWLFVSGSSSQLKPQIEFVFRVEHNELFLSFLEKRIRKETTRIIMMHNISRKKMCFTSIEVNFGYFLCLRLFYGFLSYFNNFEWIFIQFRQFSISWRQFWIQCLGTSNDFYHISAVLDHFHCISAIWIIFISISFNFSVF